MTHSLSATLFLPSTVLKTPLLEIDGKIYGICYNDEEEIERMKQWQAAQAGSKK